MDKKVKPSKKRTDVLCRAEAEEFARNNTNFYSIINSEFEGIRYALLSSVSGDEYYLAKIGKKLGFFSEIPTYIVELIRPEPVKPLIINNEIAMEAVDGFRGVDLVVEGKDSLQALYFNDDLYPFKSENDRKQFDMFCLDVCGERTKFETLNDLGDYFSDNNFVLMLKDNVFYYTFKVGLDDSTPIRRNFYDLRVRREIDKLREKYAKSNTPAGEEKEA